MKNTHAKEVISPDIHKRFAVCLTSFCNIFRYFIQNLEKTDAPSVSSAEEAQTFCCFTTISIG